MEPADYSSLDDASLLKRIARAESEALSELYDRYHRLIFSIALNSVGDGALAEEITLDIFMRVWQKAGTYREERASVATWLTRMTRNRSIDMLRRRGARREHLRVGWAEVQDAPASGNPETATEQRLEQERVRAAIAELPPEQREVLALAYFQGYTHREIAGVLGLPLGTIKTRIRLAMQKLRRALSENRDSPPKGEI